MTPIKIVRTVITEVDPEKLKEAVVLSGLPRKRLSLEAGLNDQAVSRLIRGEQASLDEDQFDRLVEAMAGEGAFRGQSPDKVRAFVEGTLLFLPGFVQADDEASSGLESAPSRSDMGRWLTASANSAAA